MHIRTYVHLQILKVGSFPPNQDTAPREEAKDSKIPYWTPGSTQADIFQQMGRQKFLEIPATTLNLGRHLRTTKRSITYVGDWDSPQGQFEVVVKTTTDEATDKDRLQLLKEASCMGQFKHVNIMRFYGVVTMTDTVSGCIHIGRVHDIT